MSRRVFVRLVLGSAVLLPLLYLLTPHSSPRGLEKRDEPQVPVGPSWFGKLREVGTASGGATDLQDVWEDLTVEVPNTEYLGGIAGYSVFSNLYLSASTFLAITDSSDEWPTTRRILSGPRKENGGYDAAGEDRWRVVSEDEGRGEIGQRAIKLSGTTYIFNDGPGGEGYLVYFIHFVLEAFLGAVRVLASVLPSLETYLPSRVWFPRCGQEPSWRDARGENVWFLAHALPSTAIEDKMGFDDRGSAGVTYLLERVVLVDRWAAHSVGGESAKWGKMNADIPGVVAPRDFVEPLRHNVMRSLGVYGPSRIGRLGLPVVVYIDQQRDSLKIVDADHDSLVNALKQLVDKAEIHVTRLSGMKRDKQIELMGRAEIIIGLHVDELKTALWMKASERSAVIELFEDDGFIRDNELLATTLGHKYYAVQNDRVLSEDEWRNHGSNRGPQEKGPVKVDGRFVAGLVESLL